MGGSESTVNLKVGTLNYSGILTSPYEYYDEDNEEERKYSTAFQEVVSKKYPEFKDPRKFSWKGGVYGKNWKSRYCPAFFLMCGVNERDNTMMTESQFQAAWEKTRKADEQQLEKEYLLQKFPDKSSREAEKQKMYKSVFQFDLFCYRAICKVIYGTENVDQIKQSADRYIKVRKPFFDKAFLNAEKKIEITTNGILKGNYDFFCIQEANQRFSKEARKGKFAEQYKMLEKQGTDSLIFLKKKTFGSINFEEDNHNFLNTYAKRRRTSVEELQKILNFNGDTVFQAINRLVIFSIHLSSKKQIYSKQKICLKQEIHAFKRLMPEYSLICGGDLNTQLQHLFEFHTLQKIRINVYPDAQNQITANKKRTMMQEQRHKAQEHNFQAKDFIFSDLELIKPHVQLINGAEVKRDGKNHLLPTNDHPYDHYSVAGTFLIPKNKIVDFQSLRKQSFCA